MKKLIPVIKQDEKAPVPVEVLAVNIKAISDGIRKLRAGPLGDRALYLLIQDAAPSVGGRYNRAPLSIKQIKAVFEGIQTLERTFLKK